MNGGVQVIPSSTQAQLNSLRRGIREITKQNLEWTLVKSSSYLGDLSENDSAYNKEMNEVQW